MLVTFRHNINVFILLLCICNIASCLHQYGSPGSLLYVSEEPSPNSGVIINRVEEKSVHHERSKRDVEPLVPQNISTWTTHLNDSHQQLMVHWVGEGSNVIICLARDSTPRNKGTFSPSALFISYDYGKNFTNKTESFKLGDAADSGYAYLDKFFNHPKYPEFCVFVDSTNKKIFYTNDNGRTIYRTDLSFHPSELAFDEVFPDRFVVLDKVDSSRKLFLTIDGGKTFRLIQSYVNTFYWSSGPKFTKTFYVERMKPAGTTTIFQANDPAELSTNATVLFDDAKEFKIKEDYMFVIKQGKEKNSLDLYISHQRGPFYKSEFQTELDLKKFHITDVTDKRIFVSVMHTENLANLYVSEINNNFTQYNFVLSLEQILCYFPDGNWKDSWLEDVTEDPFTDLYRVEGLKGIYIASKVDTKSPMRNIGPEHLVSLITFDHGNTWSPVNPPTEDENGNPLNCHIENSCSLHLCQKFSQLYPVTSNPGYVVSDTKRSASIMSSKSAPGVLMATGVMGKSLKGIPGVYLSRDAGLTWKRILKDYYFFNYGDHGGVLVAVKYFKSRGETRKILYSTNEGIDWNSYQFNADDLRIYGLMTEPGENTTTFTMFGSANDQHQWIIITIDLFNAFPRNCTSDDYKFWSPSPPEKSVSCVMGTRETFQRRVPHSNCYNGINYDRPVKKEVCECSRRDFECDYGFMLVGKECVRNKSVKFDPYETPKNCAPGQYYQRSKGYRIIDGNTCTISTYIAYAPEEIPCPLKDATEFILVALRDKIARINLADNFTLFPVKGQKNIVAIEYDMKNNCIYWADIELDKISRQCFSSQGVSQEVIVDTNLASIEGMALDWISNVLFFVDGMRRKIEAVRTDLKSEGRMRTTILDSKVLAKPRGIAVHPKAGYLFWTDWDRDDPSVSRSNLDGTNIKKLFGKPVVEWPNGITIDQMAERIYWVDAMEDYIASADLNGQYLKRILANDEKVSHPFAVAVLKDKMYWDDWKAKSIFIADKDTGTNVITINNYFSGLMDLKVFAHFVQHGSNACALKNNTCTTLCLGGPGNTYSCLCPDGFDKKDGKCLCPNGLMPTSNMTCPKKSGTCATGEFACKNGMCISDAWRCDSNNDCGDMSDEIGCPICTPPMLSCDDDTRCYLENWKCDGDADCMDMSDEKDCPPRNCTTNQFRCDNGHCVDKKWLCDGDNDCKDGSDERNCTHQPRRPDSGNCSLSGFECGNDKVTVCIPNSWVCDGEQDCPGGEDEKVDKCKNSTCAPYMFRCPNGKCIFNAWVCDGENDCSDEEASDEKNCTEMIHTKIIPRPSTERSPLFPNNTCTDWMFKCGDGSCVPYWWRCDKVEDCGDGSDELGCGRYLTDTTTKSSTSNVAPTCGKNQFTCSPGVCIPLSWVCDSMEDCLHGEDERGCSRRGDSGPVCAAKETPCADGRGCVPDHQLCDGEPNCLDRSDEAHCSVIHKPRADCPTDFFMCDDGILCISRSKVCNNLQECYDGSDEANCTSAEMENKHIYQFLSIGVDQSSINSTSFLISCWMAQQKMVLYSFLPSISKTEDGIWKNMTWTTDSVYRFTNLEPFTNYNVTFYIQDSKSNKTYPSLKYINTTTGEGVPSPPLKVTVRQMTGSRVNVEWDPPAQPNGVIKSYTVNYAPPIPPLEKRFTTNNVTVSGYFKPNKNYSFWVTASNGAFTSQSSEVSYITFDEVGDVDDIVNVSLARLNDTAIRLVWHKIRGVEGYMVQVRLPRTYSQPKLVTTKDTQVVLTNLPTGSFYIYIDIRAYKSSFIGEPFTVSLKMNGEPDETLNVDAKLIPEKRTAVRLSWERPTSDRYKGRELSYEVHYNNTFQHIVSGATFFEPVIITKNTSVVIEDLHACETYVFAVGLVGGPLSRMVEVATLETPKAPIKKLGFEMNSKKSQLTIKWNANCDVIKEPVNYRLDITELTTNKTSRYELKSTTNVTMQHVIQNVPEGGRYNVCINANVKDAVVTCATVNGRVIPPPENVLAWLASNGHLMVSWHDPTVQQDEDSKHAYQILISEKEIPDTMLTPTEDVKTLIAESSPLLTSAPSGVQGPMFVSVRSVNKAGYYSDMSEVHTLSMEGLETEEPTNISGIWWGATGGIILAVAIGAALVHLVLRHRRLERSFLRFTSATPRYDSRRGQATLGDHDDDDVPPIQGFSDDEPLVIA